MTENETDSGSKLNKQMSPVAIAAMAGGAAFAWITYQYANPLRGLFVSALVFAVIFYVVWKGQKLEKQQRDRKATQE
jgi:hypothetical protein